MESKVPDLIKSIAQSLECPVCMTLISKPTFLECGHYFCENCLKQQVKSNQKVMCGMCRKESSSRGRFVDQELGALVFQIQELAQSFGIDLESDRVENPNTDEPQMARLRAPKPEVKRRRHNMGTRAPSLPADMEDEEIRETRKQRISDAAIASASIPRSPPSVRPKPRTSRSAIALKSLLEPFGLHADAPASLFEPASDHFSCLRWVSPAAFRAGRPSLDETATSSSACCSMCQESESPLQLDRNSDTEATAHPLEFNALIQCSRCSMQVHPHCYGLPAPLDIQSSWMCDVCIADYQGERRCSLCPNSDHLALLPVIDRQRAVACVHVHCALLIPSLVLHEHRHNDRLVRGVPLQHLEDLSKIDDPNRSRRCSICRDRGDSRPIIPCSDGRCQEGFHGRHFSACFFGSFSLIPPLVSCAILRKMSIEQRSFSTNNVHDASVATPRYDDAQYHLYCHKHRFSVGFCPPQFSTPSHFFA